MRKLNQLPFIKSLVSNSPFLDKFYSELDVENKLYVYDLINEFPNIIQFHLIKIYRAQPTIFLSNTEIRELCDTIKSVIPRALNNNFELGEEELHLLAQKCAQKCRNERARVLAGMRQASLLQKHTAAFYECFKYAEKQGVQPPTPNRVSNIIGCLKRLLDEEWWLRKLKRLVVKARETVCIHLGLVNKKNGLYCSNLTVGFRRKYKHFQLEAMKNLICTNELGDELSVFDLYEKNVSNPVNRRNELMTRANGFESTAKELGHLGLFITLTCPSKYHNSYSSTGDRNLKWQKLTPHDGQRYLCEVWARIRAELKRCDIQVYGFRIAEPQHDGTPHWHLLLFLKPAAITKFKDITDRYSLEEDGDEKGAQENRVKYVDIDANKGSATGYIAKYICKNIDGAHLEEGVHGENPVEAAERVEAWASCWAIRQFQQIGGASVTVWRELRRLQGNPIDTDLKALYEAADDGNWHMFTELMGGVFCKRKEQRVRPHYEIEFDERTGEVKCSWFDDVPFFRLKGIVHKGFEIITRVHKWTLNKSSESFRPLLGVL
jgi:hypothetical protein